MIVTVEAATLCGSVIDFVTVRVVVVVQNTVAGYEAAKTLTPGVTAATLSWSGEPVVSERMGVKPGEVGIVVVPFVLVLVMVVRYSVRVVVTVKAVVYVGIGETFVLPSWVVQDLASIMVYVLWRSNRKERKEEPCVSNMFATRHGCKYEIGL